MKVICVDAERDPRWGELVVERHGELFHSPPWLGAIADSYGFQPRAQLLVDTTGRTLAGLPFCRVADFRGERIAGAPFSDFCDPLVRTDAEWRLLLSTLRRLDLPLSFRWRDYAAGDADADMRVTRRARWHGIDLEPSIDALWAAVAPAARRAVRKSRHQGITVGPLDDDRLEDFLRLHVALRKHKYRLLAQPRTFFEAIRRRFQPIGGWIPLAACHGGRVVAVTIYLRWLDRLYYKFNTSLPEALSLRPNDALLWEGIRLARDLGCTVLDLGASDDAQPGLIRFKQHYGAIEREIREVRCLPESRTVAAGDGGVLAQVTRVFTDPRVPDEVTRSAGAAWYRYFVS